MFKDAITNNKLEGFVYHHKKNLGLLERLKYRFEKNRVLILITARYRNWSPFVRSITTLP
jgi:hypothetical protein